MKKLVTLVLAAALAFSAVNAASAVEVKVSGRYDIALEGSNHTGYLKDSWLQKHNLPSGKHFGVVQRVRIGADFIMSENLSATYQAQAGIFTWGGPSSGQIKSVGNFNEALGGALGTRAANIVTRLAYLDWMLPGTDVKIRMGQQALTLPSYTFGGSVLDNQVTGVVVSVPVSKVGLTGFWVRANSGPRRGTAAVVQPNANTHDTNDLFGLTAKVALDGVEITPWTMMGVYGTNDGAQKNFTIPAGKGTVTPWWVGVSARVRVFDPLSLTFDALYSRVSAGHVGDKSYSQAGWYVAGGAEYKTAWGTPGLKGWYASGDGSNPNGASGRLLSLHGKFNASALYFDNKWGIAFNGIPQQGRSWGVDEAGGTWGAAVMWNKLSFVENLSHSLRVVYFQGTNDKANIGHGHRAEAWEMTYLTTKDHAVEIDFNTQYDIYKNLAVVLETAYVFQDFNSASRDHLKFQDGWNASVNFRYLF